MKIELPKPFNTARVGEALSSLTNYVREASRIADEIKPVLFADPHLRPDPDAVPPAPKLNSVHFTNAPPKGVPQLGFWVIVKGQNLENIHRFALIPVHDLSDDHHSTNELFDGSGQRIQRIHPPPPPPSLPLVYAGFTASPPTSSGTKKTHHYHAWVQDSFGQEDLLFNALKV